MASQDAPPLEVPAGGDDSSPATAHYPPHSSASRWRHQESSSFHRQAGRTPGKARDAVNTESTGHLADFLNSYRVEPDSAVNGDSPTRAGHQPVTVAAGLGHPPEQLQPGGDSTSLDGDIVCGPLLNYRRMDENNWHGSVLVVVKGGGREPLHQPSLKLRRAGKTKVVPSAIDSSTGLPANEADKKASEDSQFDAHPLYSDRRNTFWAFDIKVPLETEEVQYEYEIMGLRFSDTSQARVNCFFVPAAGESMRIMFYSCNGFSVGTDEAAFCGAPLWKDVLRKHQRVPFHVMIGGGDQIYNDGIRVNGPLRAWTGISNPKRRRDFPFPEKLRAQCDDYYRENYIRWYNSEPFASANGQIPQLNIWDDHDIIDGFGSYVDHFMRCDVFRGIGGIAHKYYMLFQHHLPPPAFTYTSDRCGPECVAPDLDATQQVDIFVAPPISDEQYISGNRPGPYVAERSLNMYTRLGARIALVGIDARTERTRHQVNYPETYDLIFKRVRNELSAATASSQPIKHLILLLGIPIAYPRLTWLENVLRSPIIGPIKFFHRRFGLGGSIFNHFDGSVDLLDDLDDHYTARTHKPERAKLVLQLQEIAAEYSVRITILGGDVHLAALGRFYSNPELGVPVEQDQRYMVNVISSAIVNKPPPQAVANLLARRNKIHHLNESTDETLLDLFNKDPGDSNKTANHNRCTMPSRNYAILTERSPSRPANGADAGSTPTEGGDSPESFLGRDGHSELHKGEWSAGTEHSAAGDASHGQGNDGGLDISIKVEIDQHDPEGRTQGYGLTVPLLRREGTAGLQTTAPVTAPQAAAEG